MNKPCDFCSKDVRYCDSLGTCDFVAKYNLCPVCKELTEVQKPICHKCGYSFILNRTMCAIESLHDD